MAKYPNKLVKFNTFNIIELISNATNIDISPIRQIDINISTITDIEINHIEIRNKNLNNYRYEIVSNRRVIDIYKNSIDNSSTDVEDNSSDHNSKIAYNKINNNREVKVVRYDNKRTKSICEENNKSICISTKVYIYIYNMKYVIVSGAKLVRYDYSEVLCVVCVNSKSAYTSVRSIYNIRVYNCKCGDICKT